jgi:hypothetical protein
VIAPGPAALATLLAGSPLVRRYAVERLHERLNGLAADCARNGRCEVFYSASPVKVARGSGGSVNPVVIK